MLERQILSNELVKLIPLVKEDFEWLYAAASDPEIWEQHPDRMRYTPLGFTKYFQKLLANDIAYIIIDHRTGKVIGTTSFYEFDKDKKSVSIGYTFLTKPYWGTQYNQSIKKLLLDYAYQFVDEVYFHVAKENIRSQKAIEKLGATLVREYTAIDKDEIKLEYSLKKP